MNREEMSHRRRRRMLLAKRWIERRGVGSVRQTELVLRGFSLQVSFCQGVENDELRSLGLANTRCFDCFILSYLNSYDHGRVWKSSSRCVMRR